jgi:hypothetical protein
LLTLAALLERGAARLHSGIGGPKRDAASPPIRACGPDRRRRGADSRFDRAATSSRRDLRDQRAAQIPAGVAGEVLSVPIALKPRDVHESQEQAFTADELRSAVTSVRRLSARVVVGAGDARSRPERHRTIDLDDPDRRHDALGSRRSRASRSCAS